MTKPKPPMQHATQAVRADIDRATNAYMRKVIGERLAKQLGAEPPLPPRLKMLLDQLRQQDERG